MCRYQKLQHACSKQHIQDPHTQHQYQLCLCLHLKLSQFFYSLCNCSIFAATAPNSIYQTPYPTPVPGMFIVYLLHFCPSKTSVCYGCSQTPKPNGVILNQPHDLMIVSNIERGGIMVTWCTKNTVMFISTVVNVCKKGIAVTFTLAFQQACCSF